MLPARLSTVIMGMRESALKSVLSVALSVGLCNPVDLF